MMVEMEPTAPTPPSRDGTRLLAPAFPGDTGAPDAVLRAALAAAAAAGTGSASGREALALLQGSRVLVPVMAVLGESESDEHGTTREKSSDMAAVLMTGADGRRALLAFTGTDSLEAWDAAARPVPVSCRHRRPGGPAGGRCGGGPRPRRAGVLRRAGRGPRRAGRRLAPGARGGALGLARVRSGFARGRLIR